PLRLNPVSGARIEPSPLVEARTSTSLSSYPSGSAQKTLTRAPSPSSPGRNSHGAVSTGGGTVPATNSACTCSSSVQIAAVEPTRGADASGTAGARSSAPPHSLEKRRRTTSQGDAPGESEQSEGQQCPGAGHTGAGECARC